VSRSTAILLVGYNRPELIQIQLEVLLETELDNVIVTIDCDQHGNVNSEIRELSVGKYSCFRWVFQEEKRWVGGHIPFMVTRLLSEFDNCVVIEDDVQISNKALISGINLLSTELPKDCLTIGFFGALPYNPFTRLIFGRNKWRKTEYFSAWGWATQREVWPKYSSLLDRTKIDEELQRSQLWQKKDEKSKVRWNRRFNVVADSPKFTWDFQMAYATYKHQCFHLLPIYRNADNVGFFDYRSTNTLTKRPRWYIGDSCCEDINKAIDKCGFRYRILQILDKVTWSGDSTLILHFRTLFRSLSKGKSEH